MKVRIKKSKLQATDDLAGLQPEMFAMQGKEYPAEQHNAGTQGMHYRVFGGNEHGKQYGWIFHKNDVEVTDHTVVKVDLYDEALAELESLSVRLHGGYYEPKSERDQVLGSLIKTIVDACSLNPLGNEE